MPSLNPTTHLFKSVSDDCNEAVRASARTIHLSASASTRGVLGDWHNIITDYASAGKQIPVGSRVFGSDGQIYRLVNIIGQGNDPISDDLNWKNDVSGKDAFAENFDELLSQLTEITV